MLGLVPVLHEVCSDSRDRKKLLFLHIQTQQEIHSGRLGKIFNNVLCEVYACTDLESSCLGGSGLLPWSVLQFSLERGHGLEVASTG